MFPPPRTMLRFVATITTTVAALLIAAADLTNFPANTPPLIGPPAKPKLDTRYKRMYRTQLRQQAAEGPNFNGRYRIAHWGCGTNCMGWAIIDLSTGVVWLQRDEPCYRPRIDASGQPHWIDSALDSRVFYLYECSWDRETTCPEPNFVRRRTYEWRKDRPVLLEEQCVPE